MDIALLVFRYQTLDKYVKVEGEAACIGKVFNLYFGVFMAIQSLTNLGWTHIGDPISIPQNALSICYLHSHEH